MHVGVCCAPDPESGFFGLKAGKAGKADKAGRAGRDTGRPWLTVTCSRRDTAISRS